MTNFITKTLLALGVAATVTAGSINPTISAPLASGAPANSASLNEANPGEVIEVSRRSRRAAGVLLGLGAAALIYEGTRRHYRHPGYYHRGYYGYGGGPVGYSHHNRTSRWGPDCTYRGRWVC